MRDEENSAFENIVETIWNAIVETDVDPELSHVEVMFGTSKEPWNGVTQRNVTYYLTTPRVDQLVLLSFNACNRLCNDSFPQCFRVDYSRSLELTQDENKELQKQPNETRQCGRLFAKNKIGLKDALLLARHVHSTSLAKEREQWATLVQYKYDGSFKVMDVWPSLSKVWPSNKEIQLYLKKSKMPICNGLWIILAQILTGVAIIALILVLISAVTDAIRQRKKMKNR